MSIPRRAILSITRRPLKTALLFIIIFVLGNLTAGAVAIWEGSNNVDAHIKQTLGSVVKLGPNHQVLHQIWQELDDSQKVTLPIQSTSGEGSFQIDFYPEQTETTGGPDRLALYHTIGQSDYVKSYDYSLDLTVGHHTMVKTNASETRPVEDRQFNFSLTGTRYPALLSLEQGYASLTDGRTFTQEEIDQGSYVGLITQELADLNRIRVGDTILFTHYASLIELADYIVGQIDVPIKIIGIYQNKTAQSLDFKQKSHGIEVNDSDDEWFESLRNNTIIIPNQLIIDVKAQAKQLLIQHGLPDGYPEQYLDPEPSLPTYVLQSPDDIKPFLAEYSPVLPQTERFFSNHYIYNDIAAALLQTKKMSSLALLLAILGSILIVGLTVLLFLKERRHELGILLSLGETKRNIIQQLLMEVLLVALLAMLLSLFSGQILADKLSDAMIRHELVTQADFSGDEDFWHTRQQMGQFTSFLSDEQVAQNYEIKLTLKYAVTFLTIGIGTSLVAVALPAMYTVNLKPKSILLN